MERKIGDRGQSSGVGNLLSRASRLAPRAFTLTELLVVIAIIAILGSLAVAAAVRALHRAKEVAVTFELKQLSQTAEEFKNKFSAYPPNGMNDNSNNYRGKPVYAIAKADFERFFRKAFPRHDEPLGLIQRLSGVTDSNEGNPSNLPGGMNAAEAVYFWFGGFSEDPVYPISGDGGPSFDSTGEVLENRNRMYEFELGQLGPRDDSDAFSGRFIDYDDPRNASVQRRINLWTYVGKGTENSVLYFDCSRHDPVDYDQDLSGAAGLNLFAIKKLREGFNTDNTPAPRDIVLVNKGKYQFLHSGLDDAWGDWSAASIMNATGNIDNGDASSVVVFPTGPFTGEVADTLSNFTDGTLESAQE